MALKARRSVLLAFIAVAATALSIVAVHKIVVLTQIERIVGDIRTATFLPREDQDPRVVIVAVTEDTLSMFPYRSPVDREFLSNLLHLLEQRGAAVIGLDVLFDQPTEPEKDDALKETLATLSVPLVVSYTDNPHIVDEEQLKFLDDFVPPRLRARAELPPDPADGVIRRIFPGTTGPDGRDMPGVARMIAARVGIKTPPIAADIVWHGQPDRETPPFRIFPAHAVPVLPADWFRGKIVMIGEIVSLTDRHRTPFSLTHPGTAGELPGIEIHAHAVSQLISGRHAADLGPAGELVLVLALALLGALFGVINRRLSRHMALGVATLTLLWTAGFGLLYVAGLMIPLVEPSAAFLLATWGADAVTGREARRQREFIQSAMALYLSPHYVKQLANNPSMLKLGGEMREMTLLFCDIRGFTTISEQMDAHELTRFLNRFLTPMTNVIQATGGTVDKYMGDAIMAFWNAPVDDPNHAEHACRAALAMRSELVVLNKTLQEEATAEGRPFHQVNIGIGLNTGVCCVGNLGADNKFNYSVIGDDVNLCSRLEGQTKTYGLDVVIGDKTATEAPAFAMLELDLIRVKGKTRPVHIYALVGDETYAVTPAFSTLGVNHEAMLAAYRSQNWPEARKRLAMCREQAPEILQKVYALYEERLADVEADPPPADWDGVYVAHSK